MSTLSVIVCTRNPRAAAFRRVLVALEAQTLAKQHWELLVVDNASDDPLHGAYNLSWHPSARVVREDEIGLTRARCRGIEESTGDAVVFVDDDNVLAPDYLSEALGIHSDAPRLGVFGSGAITPEFETEPPETIRPHLSLLAIRQVPMPLWSNHANDAAVVPWGAGLVVRRAVAERYRSFIDHLGIDALIDRRGERLYAGGDDLFSWLGASLGFDFGIFPQLRLTHLIPRERMSHAYFEHLIHDHAFSSAVRHYVLTGTRPPLLDWFAYARVVLHGLRRGRNSMRFYFAALSGADRAARFIADHGVQPVPIAPHGRASAPSDRAG